MPHDVPAPADPSFRGIDLTSAPRLVAALRGWAPAVERIVWETVDAETLAELSSATVPAIEQIATDGQMMAHMVDAAVEALTNHQSAIELGDDSISIPQLTPVSSNFVQPNSPDSSTDRATRVDELVAQMRAAADGYAVEPGATKELREIVGGGRSDRDAKAMIGLMLATGLPGADALGYGSSRDLALDLDRVVTHILAGTPPGETGVPVELYPDEYREWHDLVPQISAAHRQMDDTRDWAVSPAPDPLTGIVVDELGDAREEWLALLRRQAALRLHGFDADAHRINLGALGRTAIDRSVVAAAVVAVHHGPSAYPWFGGYLSDLPVTSWDNVTTRRVGEILSGHRTTALAFFNGLGPTGIAEFVYDATPRLHEEGRKSMLLFGAALASVSAHSDLSFGASDLVRADDFGEGRTFGARYVEMLLDADGYAPRFVLDAAIASLGQRRPLLVPSVDGRWLDPRRVALDAVARQGNGAALVRELDEQGLRSLLGLTGGLGAPLTRRFDTSTRNLTPVEHVLQQAGGDRLARSIVVRFVSDHRDEFETRPVDPAITNGLSILLAQAATDFIDAGPVEVNNFANSYEVVLRSGGGAHLAQATPGLVQHEVIRQLRDGKTTVDLRPVALLAGRLEAIRHSVYLEDAQLAQQASDQFGTTIGALGLVVSLLALSASAGMTIGVAGVLLSVLGIAHPSSDDLTKWLMETATEQNNFGNVLNKHIVVGAVASGRVRIRNGARVGLRERPPADGDDLPSAWDLVRVPPARVPQPLATIDLRSPLHFDLEEVDLHELVIDHGGGSVDLAEFVESLGNLDTTIESVQRQWQLSFATTDQG